MADFLLAFEKTMGHEGTYAKDPEDSGGETYKGIARRFNPEWEGWKIIDDVKSHAKFPRILNSLPHLQDEVKKFYKEYYWNINKLSEFESQDIAEEIFDTGVNMGRNRASKFLQESLNYLNRNGRSFDDLTVDGLIGPATLRALSFVLLQNEEKLLLKVLNVLQGNFYLNYMKRNPSQEKFMRGWFNRVNLISK